MEAKAEARKKLEAVALTTYAFLTGNTGLDSQVDIVPSDLPRLPDSEVDDRAQAFFALATALEDIDAILEGVWTN